MQADLKERPSLDTVTLDDKWTVNKGRVLLNGTQALARVLLAQKMLDERAGLNTAGYITGYRGSPLGNVDTTLWSIGKRLEAAAVKFLPGVNEDMAATAIRGTQQLDSVPGALYDGVYAAWYGKGPGIDRAGDAIKHGNYAGAHKNGGVVLFYGDDHGGKSSTVAHHSEQAVAASMVPSLYPSNVGEVLEYGLLGFAMSRFSGSWVAVKCVNEVVEQTATVDIDLDGFAPVIPAYGVLPPEGVHAYPARYNPIREEEVVVDHRLPLIQQFVRANRIDRTTIVAERPRLGLVTAGKSYVDTMQALQLLGLDEQEAASLGISIYKVGCIWPLEAEGLLAFAKDQKVLFVIEEKQSFLEPQVAALLINQSIRPQVIGKADEEGAPLLSSWRQLEPVRIALAIADRLEKLGVVRPQIDDVRASLQPMLAPAPSHDPALRRSPYFCSGCPHNRSTRVPEGSLSMTGIGCHTMVNFVRPQEALLPAQMGGEGGNWIGLAPFTSTPHMFQNMGDGTYYHSGLLAIRAAVASGVNITYKILYNDAVAMTGGQPIDGPISVAEIAQQVRHEGVKTVILVSDNPDAYRGNAELPKDIRIEHRDNLDAVQREMREIPGCSVLIYEQTCAAEKRRRRKRKLYPDPAKRLFISKAVCEGCGDCSVQSTCVSLTPVKTDFGVKRAIDQSSCNKDYTCLNGFCPSFITVLGAEPRKPQRTKIDERLFADIPAPRPAAIASGTYNIMVAGIGGTGVITVAAILGMAAHLEGLASSIFDMTGLAQKNGAVFSHVRLASKPDAIHAQKIGRGETDVLLAFDLVGALADDTAATYTTGRTEAVVNSDVTPTLAFQFDRDASIDNRLLLKRLERRLGGGAISTLDATALATTLLGDSIATNFFLVGFALQKGLLPIGVEAIEKAITLNGTAVKFNLSAFRLGRLFASSPESILGLLPRQPEPLAQDFDSIVERRVAHLTDYQDAAYARRYEEKVRGVLALEQKILPGSQTLATTVALAYGKLLAYKDEYEVARLLNDPALKREIAQTFADGAKLQYNLAPPIFAGKEINGRPGKRVFNARLMSPLFALLKRFKGLRGTPFDLLGRTEERRMERRLIAEYEGLIDHVVGRLTPANHAEAVKLLSLVDSVRGYGPVKMAAVEAYDAAVAAAQQRFDRDPAMEAAA
ncbi:indolepyruvate ferredoxin oxidoreductase family protein [Sphingomonas bisphenolicum]